MAFKASNLIGVRKDLMVCCSGTIEFVGIAGVFLLIAGTLQMGSGVYFLMTLPVFSVASNIWTGVVSGLTGTVLTYFGCSDRARQRPYVLFTFCIVTIVANIANIVITQVGDQSLYSFGDEELTRKKMDVEKRITSKIGLWITTGATALSLLSAFVLAIYLFCVELVGRCVADKHSPLLKTISEEVLQKQSRLKKAKKDDISNRFFPPSRLIHSSKEHIQSLPNIEDLLTLPDPCFTKVNSSWVYNSDDKVSLGLYPLGIEVHDDAIGSSTRHPPARHSSFAVPHYAKVHKRPQRAQSLAIRRDPFSLHGEGHLLKSNPVSIPRLPLHRTNRVRRTSSLTSEPLNNRVTRTLSNKYKAFTYDREVDQQVIEVGSLKSASSERDLANSRSRILHEMPKITILDKVLIEKPKENNVNALKKGTSFLTKGLRNKGPAPSPPSKDPFAQRKLANEKDVSDNELAGFSDHKSTDDSTLILDDKSSNSSNHYVIESCCEWESRNEMEEINNSETYDSHSERFNIGYKLYGNETHSTEYDNPMSTKVNKSIRKEQITHFVAQRGDEILNYEMQELSRLAKPEVINSPSKSPLPEISNSKMAKESHMKSNVTGSKEVDAADLYSTVQTSPLRILNNSRTLTSENINEQPNNVIKNIHFNYGHYETVRKQFLKESKTFLDMLPNTEVQRNKIILRVPSFKTTGCQTEIYRPVKRSNTLCTQTLYNSVGSPERLSKMSVWRQSQDDVVKLTTLSTSSSGYSSPEGESKDSSPVQSGPPSPGSSHETISNDECGRVQNGPNVTIIEVNKGITEPFSTPPRPPKPLRFRPLSDASTLYSRGYGSYFRKPSIPIPIYEENFGRNAVQENLTVLTEAVNPYMVRGQQNNVTLPRIIDATEKPKKTSKNVTTNSKETNTNNMTISSLPQSNLLRFHQLPIESQHRTLEQNNNQFGFPSHPQNKNNLFESASTAAYLASLELLASHYRQQALSNAKQLQMQQRLLDQQKLHNQTGEADVQIRHHSEAHVKSTDSLLLSTDYSCSSEGSVC